MVALVTGWLAGRIAQRSGWAAVGLARSGLAHIRLRLSGAAQAVGLLAIKLPAIPLAQCAGRDGDEYPAAFVRLHD
jgi:hypothetical protein